MKKLVYIMLAVLGWQSLFAQNIDEQRMNRDLEVAKNILATLMKNQTDMFFGGTGIEADYIDGYGVIFTLPKHFVFFSHPPAPPDMPADVKVIIGNPWKNGHAVNTDHDNHDNEAIEEFEESETNEGSLSDSEKIEFRMKSIKKQEKMNRDQEKMVERQVYLADQEAKIIEERFNMDREAREKNAARQNEETEKAMMTFLTDYADLISQLKPEEKIMIKQESPYEEMNFMVLGNDDTGDHVNAFYGISMEVSKKDISAYKAGKTSLEDFKQQVNIRKNKPPKTVADLEMFANIFKQYYSPRLSQTFFTDGTPGYDLLENYGVIYRIKTYSAYMEGDHYRMPVLADNNVNSEERRKTIETLYPRFITDLKNFMVDYGRTIRSLGNEDMLTLRIRLTRCEDCKIPAVVEASVNMSVLKQYDQQKVSREKAISSIEIKEAGKAGNF